MLLRELTEKLRLVGLRPTQQRVALASLLFAKGDRHVCAEDLHAEAVEARVPVSLATVYNTLNQFKSAGLLRELAIEGDRSYFDTNTSNHFHFFDNERHELMDIDADGVSVVGMPQVPKGKMIDRIDVKRQALSFNVRRKYHIAALQFRYHRHKKACQNFL
jgi:Fur family transcriptional regulator, iron response regulator